MKAMVKNNKIVIEENKMEKLHTRLQLWNSHLQFIEDEILFIEKLLNSYVFEPRTPSLFERLALFKQQFTAFKKEREQLRKLVTSHRNHLGGLFECKATACDGDYYQKHCKLQSRVSHYFEEHLNLKTEIYNYASNMLKRRKPVA